MNISDATFVVTDTETTGSKAEKNRVIEIGAVKMNGAEQVDDFQQLINPQRSIPSRITQLTGITTGMVFDAPTIDEVLPAYLDFLGDGVFVAHNVSFDERFVNAELERLGRSPLENETLCTVRLARRLLPGLNSKGLTRLAQFYGINVNGRHRALGDAEATAICLKRFINQLEFEHQIETLDEMLAFQHRRYQKVRQVPSHIKKLRDNVLPDVPDAPGVYFFRSSGGKLLYVGKAKSLNDRVRSYFNAVESHSGKTRKMVQKVRSVDWQTTPTELEALLLESRLIKEKKPSYNRAQRYYRRRPFIRLDVSERFPSVSWERSLADDGAEYYGPLRNGDQADLVVELIGRFFQLRECDDDRLAQGERCLYADMDRCTAPCETDDADRYAEVVDDVREFLTGRDEEVLIQLRDRMKQASDQLDFEKAAQYRDWYRQLERMLEKQERVAAPVLQHNAALIHPRDDTVHVLFVRFGQFVESVEVHRPPTDADLGALCDQARAIFDPEEERPAELSRRQVDEIRLLSHWMYAKRRTLRKVSWETNVTTDAFVRAIESEIAEAEPATA